MPDRVLLIFVAGMAARCVYKLVRRYENTAIVMLLFWGILAWRIVAPQPWQIVALGLLLFVQLGLKFLPVWRIKADFALGLLFLRRLSREERAQRATLAPDDRFLIKIHEWLGGERLGADEVRKTIRTSRRLDRIDELQKAKRRQEKLEEALERAKEEAERQSLEVTPVREPLPIRFTLAQACEFSTIAGPQLAIAAGDHTGALMLRVSESTDRDEAYGAPLELVFTYVASTGERWRCSGAFSASIPLDLERLAEADPPAEIRFWDDADPVFRQKFQQGCMAAKLLVADERRVRFPLMVGGRVVILMSKYLYWKVDLALDDDQRRVWVRVSELNEEIWKGDPFTDVTAEREDTRRVPAFYYSQPIEEFLPVTYPERFVATLEEVSDLIGSESDGSAVVFTPVAP